MMKILKKINKLELTYKKTILFAILAGVYTAIMAIIPSTNDTSFADITISFEVWILFGIFIIMKSKSAKDSALKCFLFFLISQPLVYLLQVPFSSLGWELFDYYKVWFLWTIFTIPMGYIGYYMKKDKWWGLLILAPILLFLGYHYYNFLKETIFMFPNHLLSTIFCVVTLLIYPIAIFKNHNNKIIGIVLSIVIIITMTILSFVNRIDYKTDIISSGGVLEIVFDDTYKVYFEDRNLGNVYIRYDEGIEDYLVTAEFTRGGKSNLVLEDSDGNKTTFKLEVNYNKYSIDKK